MTLVLATLAAGAVGFALYQASIAANRLDALLGTSPEAQAKIDAACAEEFATRTRDPMTLTRNSDLDWQLGPRWNTLSNFERQQAITVISLCLPWRTESIRFRGRGGDVVAEYSPFGTLTDAMGQQRAVGEWPLY